MHPVGSGFGYEGGMVVKNEGHSGAPAERNEKPGELKDVGGEVAFYTQLKDFNSAIKHLGGNARDIYRSDVAHIQNAVEPKFVEVEVHLRRPSGLQEQFPAQIGFAFFWRFQSPRNKKANAPQMARGMRKSSSAVMRSN
jgi:hypothetical protein